MQRRPDWRDAARRHGLPESQIVRPSLGVARLLAVRGESGAAEDAARAAVAADPDDVGALTWLATTLQSARRTDEAAVFARRAALAELTAEGVAPADAEEFADYRLAAIGLCREPPRVPRAWITRSFDRYAHEFDACLVGNLSYRGPELLRRALAPVLGRRRGIAVLDAGCGTGLAAPMLRRWAGRLDGVDLSARMLDLARRRGPYDGLAQGDLIETMRARPRRYDLIVAADVFGYLGDLGEAFAAAASALRPRGLFAFTTERRTGGQFELTPTGRYVHSRRHVRRCAAAAGLAVESLGDAVLRRERLRPVACLVAVCRSKR